MAEMYMRIEHILNDSYGKSGTRPHKASVPQNAYEWLERIQPRSIYSQSRILSDAVLLGSMAAMAEPCGYHMVAARHDSGELSPLPGRQRSLSGVRVGVVFELDNRAGHAYDVMHKAQQFSTGEMAAHGLLMLGCLAAKKESRAACIAIPENILPSAGGFVPIKALLPIALNMDYKGVEPFAGV